MGQVLRYNDKTFCFDYAVSVLALSDQSTFHL